jgi:hypothetical protein
MRLRRAERVCQLAAEKHCGNCRNDDPEVVPQWEARPVEDKMQGDEIDSYQTCQCREIRLGDSGCTTLRQAGWFQGWIQREDG